MAVRAYDAAVDGVGCARELVMKESGEDVTVLCSASDAAFMEFDGTEDWEGHYSAYGGVSANGYPNDALSLAFNISQSVDKGGSGTAIIEAVRIDWDFVKNWPVMHILKFGGNGAFTWGEQTTSDATTPNPKPSRSGKISIATPAGTPTYSDLTGVRKASLMVFADVLPYADSGTTNGFRRAAGPLGWEVTLDVHADDPTAQQTLNGDSELKMYIDSTTYWVVKYVKWKKIGDFKMPIDGREHVTSRYVGKGTGYVDISGTWTKGALTDPDSTDIWS